MNHQTLEPKPAAQSRIGSCLIRGLVIAGILLAAIGLLILWYNRPIQPIVLTEPEQVAIETKLAAMQTAAEDAAPLPEPTEVPAEYEPGVREITFTDRELNGLLHEHTQLGDQVAFAFIPGAVLARMETLLPEDVPLIGGRKLRARAKFAIDASGPTPMLALEDLTVWGISVPNDWLGGIKNTNVLGEAFGAPEGGGIPGVESLLVDRGRLIITLKE